jgi:hypothetical protein
MGVIDESARRRHGTVTTGSGLFHQRVSPYRRKVVLHDVESISCTEEDERGVMRINPGTRHPPMRWISRWPASVNTAIHPTTWDTRQ